MLYYDRIKVSEEIDVNKKQEQSKFQSNVYNDCHDILMMSMNLSDIAILNVNSADYRCIITGISKIETINLM